MSMSVFWMDSPTYMVPLVDRKLLVWLTIVSSLSTHSILLCNVCTFKQLSHHRPPLADFGGHVSATIGIDWSQLTFFREGITSLLITCLELERLKPILLIGLTVHRLRKYLIVTTLECLTKVLSALLFQLLCLDKSTDKNEPLMEKREGKNPHVA